MNEPADYHNNNNDNDDDDLDDSTINDFDHSENIKPSITKSSTAPSVVPLHQNNRHSTSASALRQHHHHQLPSQRHDDKPKSPSSPTAPAQNPSDSHSQIDPLSQVCLFCCNLVILPLLVGFYSTTVFSISISFYPFPRLFLFSLSLIPCPSSTFSNAPFPKNLPLRNYGLLPPVNQSTPPNLRIPLRLHVVRVTFRRKARTRSRFCYSFCVPVPLRKTI